MKIEQREHNIIYHLSVEPHYTKPKEGKNQEDAVMFEMWQYKDRRHELDALITCSAESAKSFAKEILKVCAEIENS